MWKDRFEWLVKYESFRKELIFPIVLHPEVCGKAHTVAMVERFLGWLRNGTHGAKVQFVRHDVAAGFHSQEHGKSASAMTE